MKYMIYLTRHLCTQYVALDANFRLKQKDWKNKIDNDGLIRGGGYLVPPDTFARKLKQNKAAVQMCSILVMACRCMCTQQDTNGICTVPPACRDSSKGFQTAQRHNHKHTQFFWSLKVPLANEWVWGKFWIDFGLTMHLQSLGLLCRYASAVLIWTVLTCMPRT